MAWSQSAGLIWHGVGTHDQSVDITPCTGVIWHVKPHRQAPQCFPQVWSFGSWVVVTVLIAMVLETTAINDAIIPPLPHFWTYGKSRGLDQLNTTALKYLVYRECSFPN